MINKEEGLKYHKEHPLKLSIEGRVPLKTREDLSLAYTPGVAHPCLEIQKNPEKIYKYTGKSNYVAVVTDSSAVLGLGDLGGAAGLPVMEGKCLLFKNFGGVDAFPVCIPTKDTETIIQTVKMIAPVFGGINLEDISAPRCFEIEHRLKQETDIFIFHDDQHGTAVVTLAGLINALKISGKKIDEIKVVFNGAGAASIAVSKLFISAGVQRSKLFLCDSKGVIYKGRCENMNKQKEKLAIETYVRTLDEAMTNADVFVGLSKKDLVTKEMIKSMVEQPIVFAMANPDPEIMPEDVLAVAPEAIIATGRSDLNNQINNVLGFPGIFRGALDVRATDINDDMKIAAAQAIANCVSAKELAKGKIVPSPLEKKVAVSVAKAVAKSAVEASCARKRIQDYDKYEKHLKKMLNL